MSDPRMLGLLAIGAFKSLLSNRGAMSKAEQRAQRAVNPLARKNRRAQALAGRQARRQGASLLSVNATDQQQQPTADYAR